MSPRKYRDDAERIESNTIKMPSGCWQWQLTINSDTGYGQVRRTDGKSTPAHRFSYEVFVGPVPDGLQLDHLCRNRGCVNPAHLEPVTIRENLMRSDLTAASINAAKTECPAGHPYDAENTRVRPNGSRACRECGRARWRAWSARRAARLLATTVLFALALVTTTAGLAAADELCTRHPDACENTYVPQGTDHPVKGSAQVSTCFLVWCWK